MNLQTRSAEVEIMDDLSISGEVIGQTLRELDIINTYLGGNQISLRSFRKYLKNGQVRSVADLGCGGADMLISMARMARKHQQEVLLEGVDANPHIVAYAQQHTQPWPDIRIRCYNILSPEFACRTYDIIHCCLFLHHFTEEQLICLFAQFQKQAKLAIIVNDLHRHFLAYYAIKWLTRAFSKSYMVRNDAAVSVARGFRKNELREILKKAGITDYALKWKWAFRWQLIIQTQP